ncbi:MAG: FG-GAP repeat protein [Chloracidobacterium sp.]|nr:FG-GAP repeat protein [Chloracidobacterium sp.]
MYLKTIEVRYPHRIPFLNLTEAATLSEKKMTILVAVPRKGGAARDPFLYNPLPRGRGGGGTRFFFAGGGGGERGIRLSWGPSANLGVSGTDRGAVYVFTRRGLTWSLFQKIIASDGANGDEFGSSVAIGGNIIVVGANHDDTGAPRSWFGICFCKERFDLDPTAEVNSE